MLVKTKHGDILATLIYRLFHKKWSADCLDTACCCCLQSVPEFLHRKVTMEVLTLKCSMGSNIFRVSDSLTSTSASADASYITENSGLCQVLIWLAFIFSWVPAVYLFSPFRLLHFLENSTHLSHFCGELLWWPFSWYLPTNDKQIVVQVFQPDCLLFFADRLEILFLTWNSVGTWKWLLALGAES